MRRLPMFARSLSLVASIAAGLVPLLAGEASARTRDTFDSTTATTYSTAANCRGNRITATVDTVLEDFEISMINSSTQTLNWYVYEATSAGGSYTQVSHNRTTGTAGATGTYQGSGPMRVDLRAGRSYALVVCWVASVSVGVTRDAGSGNPPNPSWGTWETGTNNSNGVVSNPMTWGVNNFDVYMKTYTSAGGALTGMTPIGGTGALASNVRGNVFDVTEDTLLESVSQYVKITRSPASGGINLGSASIPWYLFRCPGSCVNGASYTQVANYNGLSIGSGSSILIGWQAWYPNIVLEAGYRYFIGIDMTSSGTGVNEFYYSSPALSRSTEWGVQRGHAYINTSVPPTNPSAVTLQSSFEAVQRLSAVRLDKRERQATAIYTGGSNDVFGSIFQPTVATRLRDLSLEVDAHYDGAVSMALYFSPTQSGLYNQLWEGEAEIDANGAMGWLQSQAINIDLDPNVGYYALVGKLQGSGDIKRSLTGGYPFSAGFGNHVGAIWSPGVGALQPSMNFNLDTGRHYSWRVTHCTECVDLDGDGVEFGDGIVGTADDCNDRDATTYPGAPELCDGVDNNCDNQITGEYDNDQDGVRGCAGDCDDNDANTGPLMPEICDGKDNDCNATIPTNELDVDGDGFVTCALAVNPSGAVLGGGDCNDNNASLSPGLAIEACDGVDQNCDGYHRIASTSKVGSSSAATGNVLLVNTYSVSASTVLRGISTQLNAPQGTAAAFLVYSSPSQQGPWTLVQSVPVTIGNGAPGWWGPSPGSMSVPLTAGTYYSIGVWFQQSATYFFNETPAVPYAQEFGSVVGAFGEITASVPASLSNTPSASVTLNTRIYTTAETDGDGDNSLACADCNDSNSSVYPGATELCDGLDNNCDGTIPSSEVDRDNDNFLGCNDCNDSAPSIYPGAPELCDGLDNDCNNAVPANEANADGDGYRICQGDCADGNASVYPGAPELCDGLDNNCDTIVPLTEIDNDFDGFNECAGLDCNDANDDIYPGATELCDGLDNNCDNSVPATEADGDSDGQRICQGDCNDNNPATYTNAPEICDGLDNDCNGTVPANEANGDGDGYRICAGDCDDTLNWVYPGAPEVCDGRDSDCNNALSGSEIDFDGDFYITCAVTGVVTLPPPLLGGGDCNDNSNVVYPGAPELCDGQTVDNNCNNTAADEGLDGDADGVNTCTDCDDTDPRVYPGATEICDGKDSDCVGGVPNNESDPDGDRYIACTIHALATLPSNLLGGGDCAPTNPYVYPGANELCDGLDNNCDGVIPINERNPDGDSHLACAGDCNDNNAATYPGAPEICDGQDNDCNSAIPSNENDADGDGQRICAGDCNDTNITIYLGAPELCDGRDNDCNSALGPAEIDLDVDTYYTCTYVTTGGRAGYGGGDCNDGNPGVNPGATELCDGLDTNCDGVIPVNEQDVDNDGVSACAGDCDDNNPARTPGATEICDGVDNDCNGTVPANENDSDNDGVRVCAGDCNDNENDSFPGNPEVCDAIDNDCDAAIDEGFDADNDGYFTGANAGCVAAYVSVDCNDAVPTIRPGATETCDGIDQDCDGTIDEGFDADNDGYRTGAVALCVTTYGAANVDCDDTRSGTYPGAVEICDTRDQDCDGLVDDGFDLDNDGFRTGAVPACVTAYGAANVDCNDAVPTTYPGAPELCNGVNDDCDARIDENFDVDNDGYFSAANAGCVTTYGALADCDDTANFTYPGAPEVCDTEDNDCDGNIDEDFDLDGDLYFDVSCPGGDDCDDGDSTINPLATEICDGIDEDCDNAVDNGFDGDADGYYDAADPGCAATWGALADCNDAAPSINPFATEICDGVDQDCDTLIDDDFDLDGDGAFDGQEPACVTQYGSANVDCDDSRAGTRPGAAEDCNAIDDDCDGSIDEGFDVDNDGYFDGADGFCAATYTLVDCNDALPSIYPGAPETCNGLDDDCSGSVPGDETDGDGDTFVECSAVNADCDDADNSQFPGAPELCNGEDDDCDGLIDDGFDSDADGYFDVSNPFCASTYGANADCDDTETGINPGATEACNATDDDCDGAIDETFDLDSDGFFTGAQPSCVTQYGAANVDCDDGNPAVRPGRSENCTNGIDDDCDGNIDVGFDNDNDGVDTCDGDCNDSNPAVNPNATEVCDGVDNDCDASVDEGFDGDNDGFVSCLTDCDDTNPAINPAAVEVCDAIDNDCDSLIDEPFDLDGDTFFKGTDAGCIASYPVTALDCNDTNPNINPAATEVCDGLDNDCTGSVDEPFDVDLDGAFTAAVAGCVATYGTGADCDDNAAVTYPGAAEICDGLDNNCNSVVPLIEIDNDLDGYIECTPVPGHVGTPLGGGDCADGNASVHPAASELCNLIDDDCDTLIDEDFDQDSDGAPTGSVAACAATYAVEALDCDDADPAINPSADELCDTLDNDCDGLDDEDFDLDYDGTMDGLVPDCVLAYGAGWVDCDDTNPTAFPGNVEDCTNGVDDNCNAMIDEDIDIDLDGATTCGGDCNDNDPAIGPAAAEICDGIDQDCDFVADDTFDGDGDGFVEAVACAAAYDADELDCDDTDDGINPLAFEVCDGIDNDCDGAIDESFDLDEDGAFDRLDAGCVQTYGALNTDCDDADPTLNPGATEICNALDDDCDGIADEGFDTDGDGWWNTSAECVTTYGELAADCADNDGAIHPDALEECDGVDNDCDGLVPEDADGDGFFDAANQDCTVADDCDDAEAEVHPDADEDCDDAIDNDCDGDVDLDDVDCVQGDDDDSSGDDDDATGDDDDATGDDDDDDSAGPGRDPVLDGDFDGDRPTLIAGCDSCLGSVSGQEPSSGGLGLALLVALGLGLRRRRQRAHHASAPRSLVAALLIGVGLAVSLAAPTVAHAQLEQEAERQLDFAWKELEAKRWEQAISSAESALRLNPALYTAMVIKALAYEGQGELRKAESWLQTYLELTKALNQAPQAIQLADRLKAKSGAAGGVKAEATVQVGKRYTAFGDGSVSVGGLFGGRSYSQTPCAPGEGCEAAAETRPGFWATSGGGFGGGLSVRAEYFFGGWLLGARVRYDLGSGEPIGAYGVTNHASPGHRIDVNVVFRPQLTQGMTSVRLMVDVGYGLRTWTVYETVSAGASQDTAAAFSMAANQLGGGFGLRIEPGRVVGIDVRYGLAGLLGGSGGLNDHSVEVGVGIRPVKPLLIRAGFDMHVGSLVVQSERAGAVSRAALSSLRAGAFVGAGVAF